MSIISEACAEYHNKLIDAFKKRFKECETFEELQEVLKEFEELQFSE